MASGDQKSFQHSKDLLHLGNNDNLYLIKKKERPQTFQSKPSSVLGDVRAFLPKIAQANKKMEEELKTDPNKFDIEAEDDCDGPVIEMNMAMVLRGDTDSSGDSDSSSNSDSENDKCYGEVTEDNFKITKQRNVNKSLIEEVESAVSEKSDKNSVCGEKT